MQAQISPTKTPTFPPTQLPTQPLIQPLDPNLLLQSQQCLQKLKQTVCLPSWQKFSDGPCPMHKCYIENRLLSKGEIQVQFGVEDVVAMLVQEEVMREVNFLMRDIRVLEEWKQQEGGDGKEKEMGLGKGASVRVHYMRYRGVWPVQDRDFVNVSVKSQEGDTYYIASMSSKYPYPTVDKVTRAQCHIAGYILKPQSKTTTKITYISDVDVMGSIPQILKNKVAEWQASLPKQIQKVLKRRLGKTIDGNGQEEEGKEEEEREREMREDEEKVQEFLVEIGSGKYDIDQVD